MRRATTGQALFLFLLAERVVVEWNVQPALGPARVPAFLLQPLLENAFEHGAGTRVLITAEREGEKLKVSVSDDGDGERSSASLRTTGGVGLSNTRKRLTALYGAAASLVIGPGAQGGTTVTATMPYAI